MTVADIIKKINKNRHNDYIEWKREQELKDVPRHPPKLVRNNGYVKK